MPCRSFFFTFPSSRDVLSLQDSQTGQIHVSTREEGLRNDATNGILIVQKGVLE